MKGYLPPTTAYNHLPESSRFAGTRYNKCNSEVKGLYHLPEAGTKAQNIQGWGWVVKNEYLVQWGEEVADVAAG